MNAPPDGNSGSKRACFVRDLLPGSQNAAWH
jgi:hypothetical protein